MKLDNFYTSAAVVEYFMVKVVVVFIHSSYNRTKAFTAVPLLRRMHWYHKIRRYTCIPSTLSAQLCGNRRRIGVTTVIQSIQDDDLEIHTGLARI